VLCLAREAEARLGKRLEPHGADHAAAVQAPPVGPGAYALEGALKVSGVFRQARGRQPVGLALDHRARCVHALVERRVVPAPVPFLGLRALREAGSDVDDHLVFQAGTTIEDGAAAALQMLNESSQVTAVQTATDLVAVGCANMLLNQGLDIPRTVSVVGFGNILTSEYFRVPLTTVGQPKARLGTAAVEMMMQILRGERAESRRLPSELIVRASTASPTPIALPTPVSAAK